VKLLLDNGAKVDAEETSHGWTPLHQTVIYHRLAVAKLLLASGADPNVMNKDGRTPLDLAIRHGRPKIADLLKAHMAKQKPPEPAKAP